MQDQTLNQAEGTSEPTPASFVAAATASGATALSLSSDEAVVGELVRRMEAQGIFNRQPADPNAPPRARPILDALKGIFGNLIEQLGPQLMPILLQQLPALLLKLLGGLGAAGASAAEQPKQ